MGSSLGWASDMRISVTRQLFTFAEKQKDKLFWDGNVGHVKIRHKPAKTRYVGMAVIMKWFCLGQMQVNAFMT